MDDSESTEETNGKPFAWKKLKKMGECDPRVPAEKKRQKKKKKARTPNFLEI